MFAFAVSQTHVAVRFVATVPLLHRRAPSANWFGPVFRLLLSSPTTFQAMPVSVRFGAACTGVCTIGTSIAPRTTVRIARETRERKPRAERRRLTDRAGGGWRPPRDARRTDGYTSAPPLRKRSWTYSVSTPSSRGDGPSIRWRTGEHLLHRRAPGSLKYPMFGTFRSRLTDGQGGPEGGTAAPATTLARDGGDRARGPRDAPP